MREEQWIYFSKAFSTVFCSISIVNFRKYKLQNYKMGKKKMAEVSKWLKIPAVLSYFCCRLTIPGIPHESLLGLPMLHICSNNLINSTKGPALRSFSGDTSSEGADGCWKAPALQRDSWHWSLPVTAGCRRDLPGHPGSSRHRLGLQARGSPAGERESTSQEWIRALLEANHILSTSVAAKYREGAVPSAQQLVRLHLEHPVSKFGTFWDKTSLDSQEKIQNRAQGWCSIGKSRLRE